MDKTRPSDSVKLHLEGQLVNEGQWYKARLAKYRKYAKIVFADLSRSLYYLDVKPLAGGFVTAHQSDLLALTKAGRDLAASKGAIVLLADKLGRADNVDMFIEALCTQGARAIVPALVQKWFIDEEAGE